MVEEIGEGCVLGHGRGEFEQFLELSVLRKVSLDLKTFIQWILWKLHF